MQEVVGTHPVPLIGEQERAYSHKGRKLEPFGMIEGTSGLSSCSGHFSPLEQMHSQFGIITLL